MLRESRGRTTFLLLWEACPGCLRRRSPAGGAAGGLSRCEPAVGRNDLRGRRRLIQQTPKPLHVGRDGRRDHLGGVSGSAGQRPYIYRRYRHEDPRLRPRNGRHGPACAHARSRSRNRRYNNVYIIEPEDMRQHYPADIDVVVAVPGAGRVLAPRLLLNSKCLF